MRRTFHPRRSQAAQNRWTLGAASATLLRRMTSHGTSSSAPTRASRSAFGDLGCPDHLDLPASPNADLDALVGAPEGVPWDVILLSNVAEAAPNVHPFCAPCERRWWKRA